MIEPFVIAGKAKEVFRLLELKAKRAAEAEAEVRYLFPMCPFKPGVSCNSQDDATCAQRDCSIYLEALDARD